MGGVGSGRRRKDNPHPVTYVRKVYEEEGTMAKTCKRLGVSYCVLRRWLIEGGVTVKRTGGRRNVTGNPNGGGGFDGRPIVPYMCPLCPECGAKVTVRRCEMGRLKSECARTPIREKYIDDCNGVGYDQINRRWSDGIRESVDSA